MWNWTRLRSQAIVGPLVIFGRRILTVFVREDDLAVMLAIVRTETAFETKLVWIPELLR